MKFNQNLASVHAYLCADGYVIKNPPSQKHKYYYIGLRNTNDVLLKDFQLKFRRVFGIQPIITADGRCKIQNKLIYYQLTKDFSFYSNNWTFPKLSKKNYAAWLRSYFDCDGYARALKAKDRKIGLDSINHDGIYNIRKTLKEKFGIDSSVKKRSNRNIYTLTICGRDDLVKFQKYIGFLHPKKAKRLEEALNSYVDYSWDIPKSKGDLIKFIVEKGCHKKARSEIHFFSIIQKNETTLQKVLSKFAIKSRICGPWENGQGRIYYCLIIKESELKKLKRR